MLVREELVDRHLEKTDCSGKCDVRDIMVLGDSWG
jgi:hypothetical protein